jgi:bacterioferritin-associated ferredoxin
MYVCLCKAVTEGDIHALVETLGPDMENIQERCGLATDCGSCRFKAEKVIREAAAKCLSDVASGS